MPRNVSTPCVDTDWNKDKFGYGRKWFTRNGVRKGWLAHRLAWEEAFGPIPPNKCVLHRCDRPACINPSHLFLGTRADNVADMVAKGRHREIKSERTHCPNGHEFSEQNTYVNPSTGHRRCRTCDREIDRRRASRRKTNPAHKEWRREYLREYMPKWRASHQ